MEVEDEVLCAGLCCERKRIIYLERRMTIYMTKYGGSVSKSNMEKIWKKSGCAVGKKMDTFCCQ